MKKIVLIALTVMGAGIASSQAGVNFSISIGSHQHRDRHYVPPPVCAPAPVVDCRPPVVVHREYHVVKPVYSHGSQHGWGHGRSSNHGDRHHGDRHYVGTHYGSTHGRSGHFGGHWGR